MARVNICGFETGDTSEGTTTITGTGVVSVQTTTARTGYALKSACANADGSTAYFELGTPKPFDGTNVTNQPASNTFARFYFQFSQLPVTSVEIFRCVDTAAANRFDLVLKSSGSLDAYLGAELLGSGVAQLTVNRWYRVELRVGNGSPTTWDVAIDGIPDSLGSHALIGADNSGAWRFGVTSNANSETGNFFYDDVYPGPGSIVRLDPAADVAKTNWLNQAASSTNEFQSVDDFASQAGHDTDTTYVTTSTTGTVTFTVSFTALSTRQIIGTVNEIKLITFARRTGAQAVAYDIQLKPTSNAQTTTTLDGTTSYALRAILYKSNGGTDSLTIANVNTCQGSVIHTQANARELRCTAMALMVDLPGVFSPAPKVLQAVNRASTY